MGFNSALKGLTYIFFMLFLTCSLIGLPGLPELWPSFSRTFSVCFARV